MFSLKNYSCTIKSAPFYLKYMLHLPAPPHFKNTSSFPNLEVNNYCSLVKVEFLNARLCLFSLKIMEH